jgi:transposase
MKELSKLREGLESAVEPGNAWLVNAVFDLLEWQVKRCDRLEKENARLRERIAQLVGGDDPPPPAESYSLDAEDKRRQRKHRKKKLASKRKPGRKPKKDKLDCVRWVDVLPPGVTKRECGICNERPVWHIENGRAVRVGYRVHRTSWGETPRIPGVLPRCEYAVEIHTLLAYLVYVIGVSIDKACQLLQFFCELPIERSQADAMLSQLGRHWGDEFDAICDQLVMAAVVYADETSWRVGRLNTSLWAFTSELQCVMLFGCSKDRETLESILPPAEFAGTLVSDDAAVYQQGYQGQKCWAHLIRKAVKLVLIEPDNSTYASFLDELLCLYRDAKRAAGDQRLGDGGRQSRVAALEARLCDLCHPYWAPITPELPDPQSSTETDFRNLVAELLRLMTAEQLFQFVLDPRVEPTNNISERQLRNSALARKANRTNKTDTGATRQSRIVSVLESLRRTLNSFTLKSVVDHIVESLQGERLFHGTGPPPQEPASSPA